MARSGVYEIRNLKTGRCYIGSTAHYLKKRMSTHRRKLNGGRHKNRNLQSDWILFGEASFRFSVIVACNPEWVRCMELIYIKRCWAPGGRGAYNIDKHVVPYPSPSRPNPEPREVAPEIPRTRKPKSRGCGNGRYKKSPEHINGIIERLKSKEFIENRVKRMREAAILRDVGLRPVSRERFARRISARERIIADIVLKTKE